MNLFIASSADCLPTLRSVPTLQNGDRIIHLLELYVSFFTHKPVPRPLRAKRTLWQKITFQGREAVYGWESGRDLTLVKTELNELLRAQKQKIIIIIDNISRLYDHEIKQVFQVVKSMGDYANTAYLLSYDKEQVTHAIDKLDGSGGNDYIDKIVQLPFEVPPISQTDLENILADRLNPIIDTTPEDSWNTEYWADIYYSSLKYFFHNVRDISRYVNTLNFSYPRLRDVVNPVDFFALTAIEIFMPDVYVGIRENKDLFTDLLDNVYALDHEQIQKDRLRCDEIIARNHHIQSEILFALLIRLFPRIRRIYYSEVSFYHSDAVARKLRRLCNPDLFDVYFRLSMQMSEIPVTEFETLLSLASDATAFDQAVTRLNQDDRILPFLSQLDSKVTATIPHKNIQAIINALFDNGDLFPPGISGPLSLDTPRRIHRIVHSLLERLDLSDERFIVLQNAIANATKSLYIMVHELREQGREHVEEEDIFRPVEFRDLNPEQLDSLRKLVASRIETWAINGSLVDHPKLMPLLYAWRDWGDSSTCIRYVQQITDTDRGLVAFLTSVLDKAIVQAMTQYEKNPVWENYLEDINAFIPATSLADHARTLFEDGYFEKLREREQLALMIFLDLLKAPTSKVIPNTTV